MTESIDCAVIGAGVVGLAIARALATTGHDVIVLEATDAIGTGTSSRNSEVIHAGIYYPKNSLKALMCVRGKQLLYEYCESRGVEHRRIGKLLVATTDDQISALEKLRDSAAANGVTDLKWIEGAALKKLEPELRAVGAFLSPSTGIIDSHGLMLAYQGEAEDAGAMIAFNSPVRKGHIEKDGIVLSIGGEEPMTLSCRTVINSAGLYAQFIAASIEGLDRQHIPPCHFAKGNYFTLSGRAPFSRPIYPIPEAAGLGIHLTLDLGGQAKFGPDVEWLADLPWLEDDSHITGIDYTVDPARGERFYAAIRTYWPGLPDNSLLPGYAGIRPKIQAPDEAAKDYMIQGPNEHGINGLVNLFGIESPGLTSSLAIAEEVLKKLA
ncbi:MAG: NAD(P)/FAD-dependent oxidoreductase [Rhodospirillales bacterium]|jgi:L-2-hydroxyglutarate oxidase LhgO